MGSKIEITIVLDSKNASDKYFLLNVPYACLIYWMLVSMLFLGIEIFQSFRKLNHYGFILEISDSS
jgi:hypothetical protein